jgi:hypothetical protein
MPRNFASNTDKAQTLLLATQCIKIVKLKAICNIKREGTFKKGENNINKTTDK